MSHVGLVQIVIRHVTVKSPAAAARLLRSAASSCPRQLTLHSNKETLEARLLLNLHCRLRADDTSLRCREGSLSSRDITSSCCRTLACYADLQWGKASLQKIAVGCRLIPAAAKCCWEISLCSCKLSCCCRSALSLDARAASQFWRASSSRACTADALHQAVGV